MEAANAVTTGLCQDLGGVSVSVVVPLYNESGNVSVLVTRLHAVFASLAYSYQIILVDDGSEDATWNRIVELTKPAAQAGSVASVLGCRLSRNFGNQAALLAGLHMPRGDVVITMDGDLQHPPEVIPELLRQWEIGFDIVGTQRIDIGQTSLFKRLTSRYFCRVFSMLAEVELQEGSSDFRLIDSRVLRSILGLRDTALFLRGTVEWVGFHKTIIPYRVGDRLSADSKYSLARMLRFAGSAIVAHSTLPLRISVWIGLVTSSLACLEIIHGIKMMITEQTVPGWASILIIQSFLGYIYYNRNYLSIHIQYYPIYRLLQMGPNFIIADTTASDMPSARPGQQPDRGATVK